MSNDSRIRDALEAQDDRLLGVDSADASPPLARESTTAATSETADMEAASDDSLVLGQVVGDRYRVSELLGRGGMGAVYRADHVHIKKSFALKVLHRELTHHVEAVKRFEREAIAAARIDHPNVATAIDFGRLPSGAFYLVLDYVQGRSLRQLLNDEHHLSEARSMRIARQIASALSAAHARGVVHRDLKPDNVMLVESGNEPDYVKVLDFGIAKLRTEDITEEPAITRFGTVFGTPEYMSPEQALGQNVDARSDLYTLGIMLYEMLVGKTPFADEQLVTVLTRQMTEPPAPLPEAILPELRRLVARLLEKRPESRPESAEVVLSELELLLSRYVVDQANSQGSLPSLRLDSSAAGQFVNNDTILAATGSPDVQRTSGASSNVGTSRTAPRLQQALLSSAERNPSLPPWVRRQVSIAGRRVPLVVLAMAATLVVGLTIGGLGIWAIFSPRQSTSDKGAPILSVLIPESAETKQLKLWIDQAARGDATALQNLEKLPESSRTASAWMAIAAGRAETKSYVRAVAAYARAASIDADLVERSSRTASDIYRAALDPEASTSALEFAAEHLGAAGADIVYACLEAASAGRGVKFDRRKAKSLLDSPKLAQRASAALRVTLKLEDARSCADYKALLAEANANGDQRAYRLLRKLSHDRGCGLLGLQDCYPCMRGGRALAQALEATKSRPSPSFAEGDAPARPTND